MFFLTLVTTAKLWKHSSCLSTKDYIKKVHTTEYYSNIKRKYYHID